jgi:tRNA dimethylallyltransferase
VVVALMGPTASGKTRLGIQLAQAFGGEIISVDSSLVYRGMDIGTAKPTLQERAGVAHHLIDIIDPREVFSTGQFREQALCLIEEISRRGRLPLLVGGTMLYFKSLFSGLADLPEADPEMRRQIDREAERFGWGYLHDQLQSVDPAAARRIHPNDPQRIQRALEVYRLTGQSLSALWETSAAAPPALDVIRLIVAPADRSQLHARIRARFLEMLERGLMAEAEALFRRGDLDESRPALRAVGYRQLGSFLKGECDRETMIDRAVAATRQFAKRQYTWLRREREALSFVSEAPDLHETVVRAVSLRLRQHDEFIGT